MGEQEEQKQERIRVSEIFGPTIQGEGLMIGEPTVFVRTGGCDFRCSWCDTLHAVEPSFRHEWRPLSAQVIMERVCELSENKPLLVTLSGGNPAIQPLESLIALGQAQGYRFGMETQGSIVQAWFGMLDHLTLSPKPPSSGMSTDWGLLQECITAAKANWKVETQLCLKIAVFDDLDYDYAQKASGLLGKKIPVVLQPVNHTPAALGEEPDMAGIMERMRWLVERTLEDQWYDVRVLPQLHVLLWGNERGV